MVDKTRRGDRKRSQAKDRVLQARIPEQLDDEIRGRAEQLGLSVSTIVRNVLLNTFDLVEGVVSDSSQIARALSGHQEATPTHPQALSTAVEEDAIDDVIGWQQVVLNKNGICEQCNAILAKGESAAMGVPASPRALLLCPDCLAVRTSPATPSVKKSTARKKKQEPSSRAPSSGKGATR